MSRSEREARNDKIRELAALGWSQRRIAADVGCHPVTVKRVLRPETAAQHAASQRAHRARHPDVYRQRWDAWEAAHPEVVRAARRAADKRRYDTEAYREWQRGRYAERPEESRARSRADYGKRQRETLPTAVNRGKQWTGPELEIAAREDLTATQVALMLGRTEAAVRVMRHKLREDPRKINLAGLAA